MDKIKGKRSIRKVFRNMLIVLSTAAVILSAGYIVARLYDYYASARAYRTIEEMYVKHPLETEDKEPSVTESPAAPKEDREIPVAMEPQGNAVPERMKVDWDGLRAANPDVVAWLYVPMAGISYPVVQGGINDEYLHKSFTGEYRYARTGTRSCTGTTCGTGACSPRSTASRRKRSPKIPGSGCSRRKRTFSTRRSPIIRGRPRAAPIRCSAPSRGIRTSRNGWTLL